MHKRIQRICGESEIIPDFDAIGNNPNFVFTNDPNFDGLTLFNENGNTVMVNSWVECAHYVNGNWTNYYSDFFNGEKIYFAVVTTLFTIYIIYNNFYKKLNNS